MSKIEWTEETWNPVTGCDRISPGCDNCYALTMAKRLKAMGQPKYQADGDPRTSGPGFGVTCHPDELARPSTWRKPRTVFVNSMSDLFHQDVPMRFVLDVWSAMANTPQHIYQVLTKRPQRAQKILDSIAWDGGIAGEPWEAYIWGDDRMADYEVDERDLQGGGEVPLRNVWLGTSIESDRYTYRADYLRRTPAAVRFLSLEPLLGPLPSLDLTGMDWVIVGGESGRGARPMHPDWVRDIRDRCAAAGIPFFFKQWGQWSPAAPVHPDFDDQDQVDAWDALDPEGPLIALEPSGAVPQTICPDRCDHQPGSGSWWMAPVGKKAAGRALDGIIWSQQPEVTRR